MNEETTPGTTSAAPEGVPVRNFGQPVKRYCQILEIENNPGLIELYRESHSRSSVWKEILDGIREVGILEMELYISGNRVVMIVEAPLGFDWESAMKRLSGLPRQAEWEAHVARYQGCDPSATSDQKWTMMERMFHLYD